MTTTQQNLATYFTEHGEIYKREADKVRCFASCGNQQKSPTETDIEDAAVTTVALNAHEPLVHFARTMLERMIEIDKTGDVLFGPEIYDARLVLTQATGEDMFAHVQKPTPARMLVVEGKMSEVDRTIFKSLGHYTQQCEFKCEDCDGKGYKKTVTGFWPWSKSTTEICSTCVKEGRIQLEFKTIGAGGGANGGFIPQAETTKLVGE